MAKKTTYNDLVKRVQELEQIIAESESREEALRRSEGKYRTILENIEDGYYEIDLEGKYTFVNQAVCKNQGLQREDLIGTNSQDHLSPEEGKRLYKILLEVYQTGNPASLVQYEVIRKDGTKLFFEDTITLLRDKEGAPFGFSGIGRNITERKRNEEALVRREKEYQNILELSPAAISITNLNTGMYVMVNQALCQQSGYLQEELIGRSAEELNIYAGSEDRERMVETLRETGQAHGVEIRIRAKDQTIHDCLVSFSVIRYQNERCLMTVGTDISPLKEAQKALREGEEKYRNILENMEEGYYETDLSGTLTFFNEAECRIHECSAEELMLKNNREFSSPDTAKRVFSIFNQVYKTGIPAKVVDYEILTKDGSKKILETSVSLLRNTAGDPIGFYGVSRDVTEKKKAEQALRESEEKYRNILENMEEVYYEVDLAGNMIFFNPAMLKSFGRTAEEMMGMNYREYTSPEGAALLFSVFNEVYRTGIPNQMFDFPINRIDGAMRVLEGSVSLLKDGHGEAIGFRGMIRDRTEQKRAEDALKESEEKYRLLVENAHDGIYILQDGVLKFSNPKIEKLTGYDREKLTRMNFTNLIDPRDYTGVVDRLEKNKPNENSTIPFSFRIIDKENEVRWVELNTVEIVWEGQPATLNFLRDITPQKKMEAQFLQAQKMEAIGTLAGGIAHDFNNLLMGVQGNTSLILLDTHPDHSHFSNLKGIEQQVKAGAELTRQLLGVARGGKYEARPTDVNQLIARGLDMFSRTRKELRVHKYFAEGLWSVEVDRSQIEQVLLNLYVNAGHAMPGGGDLYVETKNVILDESYTRSYGLAPGKFVRTSVTDTGMGMDENTQKRAFDPFFTTREMGRGTGLGLASAYGIIRNHSGIINIYSEKGKGTTFNIYLPVTDKKLDNQPEMFEEVLKGNESILFVDDEEPITMIGRQLLERLGYRVMTARSGQEALNIYQREGKRIDLVIIDMIMPGMNGGETFDRLKGFDPSAKVILSSGYSLNGQAKNILDRGCQGFLQKPFSLADLSKRVRQVLDMTGQKAI